MLETLLFAGQDPIFLEGWSEKPAFLEGAVEK